MSRRDLLLSAAGGLVVARAGSAATLPASAPALKDPEREFLEDYAKRCFTYFVEQASPHTGMVMDRAGVNGSPSGHNIGSLAATGFGLSALCIGASRGWIPKDQARIRIAQTLRYLWGHAFHDHGWFLHFADTDTGARRL
ncbi:MAG: hypothetical protein JO061_22235, partial [Acidobacteriaceae bacterium]|nr:hypothetical protein [Acidobacteriaceae bacterium]